MTVNGTSLQPFLWTSNNLLPNAKAFLDQKWMRITSITRAFLTEAEYNVSGGKQLRWIIKEQKNDIQKLYDKAQETLGTLSPVSNEYNEISRIAQAASEQLNVLNSVDASISELVSKNWIKFIWVSGIVYAVSVIAQSALNRLDRSPNLVLLTGALLGAEKVSRFSFWISGFSMAICAKPIRDECKARITVYHTQCQDIVNRISERS